MTLKEKLKKDYEHFNLNDLFEDYCKSYKEKKMYSDDIMKAHRDGIRLNERYKFETQIIDNADVVLLDMYHNALSKCDVLLELIWTKMAEMNIGANVKLNFDGSEYYVNIKEKTIRPISS